MPTSLAPLSYHRGESRRRPCVSAIACRFASTGFEASPSPRVVIAGPSPPLTLPAIGRQFERAACEETVARQLGASLGRLGNGNAARAALEDELFAMVSVPRDHADELHRDCASGTQRRNGPAPGWRALVANHGPS